MSIINKVEQVTELTYLGAVISRNSTSDDEITTRIGNASGAFNPINNIWINKGILLSTKIRKYHLGIWS